MIIVDAVDRFRRTVTAEHKREIEKTAVKDVIVALVAFSKTQQELPQAPTLCPGPLIRMLKLGGEMPIKKARAGEEMSSYTMFPFE